MKKAFLILLAALPLICACAETFSPVIQITPSLSSVPYTGGSVDVTVMTDLPWKVVLEEDSPATLSKAYGVGDDVVTVNIPATDNWTTSCIKVQFYCRSNSSSSYKYAYITQGYKPYIYVSGESGLVDVSGGTVFVVVTANADWTWSCDIAGVTVQPNGGQTGNYTAVISVPANTSGQVRKITVNFAIDGDSDSFVFFQAG
ncbi:MAG: BACON domain-containing protein [Bacteroidales bacterium]|nr:BACON domain-containing protein [Bacteroidales bacterium]